MDPEIEKILRDQMEKLPANLVDLFTSNDLYEKIKNIGIKNKLNNEQSRALETEIYLIILGLENEDGLIDNLTENLPIEVSIAISISRDVDQLILDEIRDGVDEVYKNTNNTEDFDHADWQENLNFIISSGNK
jgi:ABC-type Na+ transport system ATPase subunit NatA